jgi:long-chain fatty acid transport protein
MRRSLAALAALALAALASAAAARDLGRQNYLVGERASGMGGAFVALTGDAASAYYNPAGLGAFEKKGLSLSASAYQLSSESYPSELNLPMAAGGSIAGDMSGRTFATFPSSVVYVLPLDEAAPGATRQVLAFSVLVPDFDKVAVRVSVPAGAYLYDLQGSYTTQDQTYWFGPSYAEQRGRWRWGASLFGLAHVTDTQGKIGQRMVFQTGERAYTTTSIDKSGTAVTMLAQLGAQVELTERLTFGATVRSPTFGTLYSSVSMLALNSMYAETGAGVAESGYADRIEVKHGIELDYRRPLLAAAGLSYRVPDRFAVALDVTYHAALPAYDRYRGPLTHPLDASGNPIPDASRALNPVERAAAREVVDLNLGVEVNVSKAWIVRAGVFTDRAAVDATKVVDQIQPRLDGTGFSFALGRVGDRSTTSLGVVYVTRSGTAPGLNSAFGYATNEVKVTGYTATLILSGSADL